MKLTKKENRRLYDFIEEYCKKNEIQIFEMKCTFSRYNTFNNAFIL